MRAKKHFYLLSVLLILTSSCGDDATKKSNNANNANNANNVANNANNANNVSGDELADLLKNTACEATFECTSPFLTPVLGRYESVAECKNDDGLFFFGNAGNDELELAISARRVTYDPTNLDACVARIKEGLCSGSLAFESPECNRVVVGNVDQGGNCASSQECADGRECEMDFDDEQCFGTCQPNCGEENCTADQYCQNGETCLARLGDGETCDSFDSCQQGLYCRDEVCTAGGDVAMGGSCDDARDCASGLTCFEDTCTAINAATNGQACDVAFTDPGGDSLNICQAGTVCTNLNVAGGSPSGTCGPPKIEGAECNYFAECAIGLTCDATDPLAGGNCVPTYANGQSCTNAFDCQSNRCSDGMCMAPLQEEVCVVP